MNDCPISICFIPLQAVVMTDSQHLIVRNTLSYINQVEVSLKLGDTVWLISKVWSDLAKGSITVRFLLAGPVTMPLCCFTERLWNRYPSSDKPSNLFGGASQWVKMDYQNEEGFQPTRACLPAPNSDVETPLRLPPPPHKSSLETGMLTWTQRASTS